MAWRVACCRSNADELAENPVDVAQLSAIGAWSQSRIRKEQAQWRGSIVRGRPRRRGLCVARVYPAAAWRCRPTYWAMPDEIDVSDPSRPAQSSRARVRVSDGLSSTERRS